MSEKKYQRFTLSQRIEHILGLSSFTILAVTGLPQKYAAAAWAQAMINGMGGIEFVRFIHRGAAIILMMETIYHLTSAGYKIFVERTRFTMLPGIQDALDALYTFLYNLGLRPDKPQVGRYSFEEKAEYWAFAWGTIVMVITGFIMWNPIATTNFFPGEFIPAAKAAHGGEALLAVLAIILWHFYGVHLKHFNKSMWTGHMTEEEMVHEHPLELAEIKAGMSQTQVEPTILSKRRKIYLPVAIVFAAVLLVGLYGFVTFEKTAIDTVARPTVVAYATQQATPFPTRRPTATAQTLKAVWEGNISNLFKQKCIDCHGGTAGIDFATYGSTLRGGATGPIIVPKDADKSKVVIKMAGPHPGKFSDAEMKILRDWITLGAPEK